MKYVLLSLTILTITSCTLGSNSTNTEAPAPATTDGGTKISPNTGGSAPFGTNGSR